MKSDAQRTESPDACGESNSAAGIRSIERANVLGIGVSAINLQSALGAIAEALERKTKGYICVTGVHGVMEAQRDLRLRGILNEAFLNTPDGMPMVWVGRLQGFQSMARVYGPDLMLLVCEFTKDKNYTHFLYGGGTQDARVVHGHAS